MNQTADNFSDSLSRRGLFPFPVARGFVTVALSTIVLLGACLVFAPSSISSGALAGSLPFAAVIAIVGLGQLLVVQQGGFDLSVAGGVSLAVVISAHFPDGDNARLLPAVFLAASCALAAGLANGILVGFVQLNAIIATIGVNALLYGAVFAVSGGVPGSPRRCSRRSPAATRSASRTLYFSPQRRCWRCPSSSRERWSGEGSRRLAPIRWRRARSACTFDCIK